MKKVFLLSLFSAVVLLTGCSKENPSIFPGDTVSVAVTASLPNVATKAVIDGDGQADSLNHWVIEVRDTLQKDVVYYWFEKAGEKGVTTQTFELTLVKGHTYDIALWADKSGCYNATNLKQVSFIDTTKVGNSDSYDAFFACKRFKADGTASMEATLYRPLAQVNIITTDLPKLKAGSTEAAYLSHKPKIFSFKTTLPTEFDVYSGETSVEKELTITPAEPVDTCYADFAKAAEQTTIHMIYVLTTLESAKESKSDVRNINFAFESGGVNIPYEFTDIPLKRNFRTNIIGNLLSEDATVTVTVDPGWDSKDDGSDDINVDYTIVTPFVEIGGVKWATMNLGATTVAGSPATCAGDYYQWGSVSTLYNEIPWGTWSGKGNFTITSWKDGKSSGFISDNREYKGIDSVLPDAKDVVKQKVGNGWRIPTSDNFEDLYNACIDGEYDKATYASTACGNATDFVKGIYWCVNYDGVPGCLFCDGTNKLFFPASGMGSGSNINLPNLGGAYCSSTFAEEGKEGRVNTVNCLNFSKNICTIPATGQVQYGFSIRPVKD